MYVYKRNICETFHEMKGDRDGKSAKTSATRNCPYSAVTVVVNDHNMYPVPIYIIKRDYRNMKNDIGGDGDTYDHSLQLHYRGSFLLHSFLLICHPYPLSFHEMIFILV